MRLERRKASFDEVFHVIYDRPNPLNLPEAKVALKQYRASL
jgi:hypothetical protein